MAPKIAILGYATKKHKGEQALLVSRISALREVIPEAQFFVFAKYPADEEPIDGVKFVSHLSKPKFASKIDTLRLFTQTLAWAMLGRVTGRNFKGLIKDLRLQTLYRADLVVTLGGDTLTLDYGHFSYFLTMGHYLFPVLLHKPLVIYAEGIGLFHSKVDKLLAKFLLERASLVTLRENISQTNVKSLQLKKLTPYVTADSAFLLEAAPIWRAKAIMKEEGFKGTTDAIVGFSVSRLISQYGFSSCKDTHAKYQIFVEVMAQVADYVADRWNATILFVPHVMVKEWDDRRVGQDISKIMRNKHRVILLEDDYTAAEMKAVIGRCDLFVGCRMHALIAATSMGIPAIAIAYSQKTYGIIGDMLGLNEYIVNIKDLRYEELVELLDKVWSRKDEIKAQLRMKTAILKNRALDNARLVKQLLSCAASPESPNQTSQKSSHRTK